MKRLLTILLLAVFTGGPAVRAQVASDTTAFRPASLIAPGLLMGSGVAIHCFAHESIDVPFNTWVQEKWRGDRPELGFDNIIQYVPLAMDLGLGLVGVPAENGFVDRVIEGSVGGIILGTISWTMKKVIDSPRPNGRDSRSFPSGHTDWVFFGAELVRLEYGWGWGAGAYAVATTVAVMRNYNNWHWLSDVLMGAGLGIVTADIGHYLLEPTKRLLGIRTSSWGSGRPAVQAVVAPSVDPYSGAICTTLALRF